MSMLEALKLASPFLLVAIAGGLIGACLANWKPRTRCTSALKGVVTGVLTFIVCIVVAGLSLQVWSIMNPDGISGAIERRSNNIS